MFKPSTYACFWPIEFCQIVVTLGRIFSCFHDQDHVHPHIHANSYTGSYTKHIIHPPKINTPKFKEISLLVILQKERWVMEKKYILKKHRKNMLWSKSKEKKRKRKNDPLQNKSKRKFSKQGVFRKHKTIPHTCTSQSSCMTSFFLDPVLGSTISCGTSESHTYPTQSSINKP
jgi:hypothetical protein